MNPGVLLSTVCTERALGWPGVKTEFRAPLTFSWAKYLADRMMTWLLAQPDTWLRVEMAPCTASGERDSS